MQKFRKSIKKWKIRKNFQKNIKKNSRLMKFSEIQFPKKKIKKIKNFNFLSKNYIKN